MATEHSRQLSTTRGTSTKQHRAWSRWKEFLRSIDLSHDVFLETLERHHKLIVLSAFGHTLRTGEHSKRRVRRLGAESIRNAIDHVAQTFRRHFKRDPRLDHDGKPAHLLQYQYKSYQSEDPPPKQQKALPVCVIMQLHKDRSTERARAIADLCTGAFFFAMRLCEYLHVQGTERKTKQLRLRNIRFFRNHKLVPHSCSSLLTSDFVSITFEDQKNSMRNDTITMHASNHAIMCPVRSWARVVRRVSRCYGNNTDTLVSSFRQGKKIFNVSSKDALVAIRAAAQRVGESKLGFKVDDIGTHSLRSGAAMAMYLDDAPVYTIMIIGRWSSDAFLLYIRKQVEQFSHNVSTRMVKNMSFTHVPTLEPRSSNQSTRLRNDCNEFQTRQNMGPSAAHIILTLPTFSIRT